MNIEKEFYPDGNIQSERSYENGIPHGFHREWHDNGQLASEIYFVNGVPDGVGSIWDQEGNLIIQYEIVDGTGIQKHCSESQGIWSETSWVNGELTGRQRTYWIKDNTVAGDTFWINSQVVSKKKYMKACETNPNLPKYDSEELSGNCPSGSNSVEVESDKTIRDILNKKCHREAHEWLYEPEVPERSLGETKGWKESIELVQSLYDLGAKKVWVIDIDGKTDEEQNSGRLIVELPTKSGRRTLLLRYCNELGLEQGYDQEADSGQKYILLMLD